MNITRFFWPGLVVLTLAASPSWAGGNHDDDDDHDGGKTACERTADRLSQACRFDVRDDYNLTVANCLNIADRGDRRDCQRDAREARREAFGECDEVEDAREDACDILGENRYDPDPLTLTDTFIDPNGIPAMYAPNPYVSLEAGHTYVLRAGDEGEETVVVHVTPETRDILGVPCRIVVDIVVETSIEDGEVEYEAVEVTDDWFAQTVDGDVVYCGEIARNFEDGILRDLDGSFEAGLDFAKAGFIIKRYPEAGVAHRQEFALGEAEDIVQYVSLNAAPSAEEGGDVEGFECAPDRCLQTFDFAPIDPASTEFKYYLPGTGFVLAVAFEDGELTGEREELVCTGGSLDILGDPACGIDRPDLLLEELCRLSPDAFCDED